MKQPITSRAGQLLWLAAVTLLAGCGGGGDTVVNDVVPTTAAGWRWTVPSGFPQPRDDPANPMTAAKVELGRYLFYDPRLSANGTQSCSSCHQQARAFTDGLPVAIGSTGDHHPRNTQSLVNVVYQPTLTWANPSLLRLEKQMEVPLFIEHPIELGLNDSNKEAVMARFRNDSQYQTLFRQAFPADSNPVTLGNVVAAIGSFQRSIISAESRYDHYLQGKTTLNASETRGMNLFFSEKAECFHCHGGFNFTDQSVHAAAGSVPTPFHNTGLYNLDG